ncbi:MAG: protein kinase [Gemmatimonadaceae bacterium]
MNAERATSARAALQGQYEIIRELGLGGTAVVYLARNERTGEEVAIKLIRSSHLEDDEALARFAREARLAADLDHPNVVKIRDVLPLGGGRVAIVMAHVNGRTLKQVILDEGRLSPERAEAILRDVAAGLDAAHAMQIIHRDVKPENIFVDTSGHALLGDFGLARSTSADTQLTMTGVAIGTPTYMPPEQIDGGAVDARGDIYSLGLVAWEMLNGRRPWDGASLYALLYHQKHDYLPDIRDIRDDVPERLANVITTAIEKNADHRWQSVSQMIDALDGRIPSKRAGGFQGAASDTVRIVRATPVVHDVQEAAAPGRSRILIPALVALAIALLTGGVFGLHTWLEAGDPSAPAKHVALSSSGDVGATQQSPQPQPTPSALQAAPVLRPLPDTQHAQTLNSPKAPPAGVASATHPASPLGDSTVRVNDVHRSEALAVVPRASHIPVAIASSPHVEAPPPPVAVNARSTVVAGGTHTCLIASGGRGYCWGANTRGQLGSSVNGRSAAPTVIDSDLELTAVAAGLSHTCALVRGGAAWCWGDNDRGQLGDRTNSAHTAPTRVADGHTFRAIATGAAHSCAIDISGMAWCWGSGTHGQLGNGVSKDASSPVAVTPGRFSTIASGWNFTCGLGVAGRMFCWGENNSGQLGTRDSVDRAQPTLVADSLTFVAMAAGSAHACGITTRGDAYCWGKNSSGQLGDGTTSDRVAPTRVKSDAHFTSIAAGAVHTCAIDASGQAYCWGLDSYGQLGDGGSGRQVQPVRVAGDHSFSSLSAFGSHTCGTTLSGEAFCWGYNLDGQLGDATRVNRSRPVYLEPPIGK